MASTASIKIKWRAIIGATRDQKNEVERLMEFFRQNNSGVITFVENPVPRIQYDADKPVHLLLINQNPSFSKIKEFSSLPPSSLEYIEEIMVAALSKRPSKTA